MAFSLCWKCSHPVYSTPPNILGLLTSCILGRQFVAMVDPHLSSEELSQVARCAQILYPLFQKSTIQFAQVASSHYTSPSHPLRYDPRIIRGKHHWEDSRAAIGYEGRDQTIGETWTNSSCILIPLNTAPCLCLYRARSAHLHNF